MSWVEQTLQDFGQTLGLPEVAFNDRGVAQLSFESRGELFIERGPRELLIYLVRPIPVSDGATLRRALELCHFRHEHPFVLQAGLRGDDQLLFLARLPEADFTLPNLERALGLLSRMHQAALGGAA